MSEKILELKSLLASDELSTQVVHYWETYNTQREVKMNEWQELRNYVFATDTSSTSNSPLPWKNRTTLPKLCQIRDNLHSNYLSALFPNADWLRWEAYSADDATKEKAEAIEAYIKNKTRIRQFSNQMSSLLYDYIDKGNAFGRTRYVVGRTKADYTGPVVERISPLDIVFNPLATDFNNTFKVIRYVKTFGEILAMCDDEPENHALRNAVERHKSITAKMAGMSKHDQRKVSAYTVDGFGNLYEYYQSGYVELLEFHGSIYNGDTGELKRDRVVIVMDRSVVIKDEAQSDWVGYAPIFHVGWRKRPDNLWHMGPLDNLVGLQYRIDHLENARADAVDLAIHPPLKIVGEVEEFMYGPNAKILLDEGGDVQELAKNTQWVIAAQNDIASYEAKMEIYAGAPREAMGIRTPGEKTAFEVQSLQNAAGRIFQEKVTNFEVNMLEPLLNDMLRISVENLNGSDVVRTIDDDLAIQRFISITKDDLTAAGNLRPVGARHFAAQAQLVQNLVQLGNSTIGQTIAPHLSSIKLAKLIEDVLGLERYDLVSPNIAVEEQLETERLARQAQEDLAVEQGVAQGLTGEPTDQAPVPNLQGMQQRGR